MNLQETTACKGRDRKSQLRTPFLQPLRIKPEADHLSLKSSDEQGKIGFKRKYVSHGLDILHKKTGQTTFKNRRVSEIQSRKSKKCTVLDLLFDRQVCIRVRDGVGRKGIAIYLFIYSIPLSFIHSFIVD